MFGVGVYTGWDSELVVRVGTGEERREFRAPRNQFAQQSGYIKSLLESCPANEITLPSVSPQVFAPILRYVSTGFLELTPENVYAVLLATHILHMPRAVDICRGYLLREQNHHQEARRLPLLVKPIPSRKYLPSLYWPPPPPIFPPPPFYHPPSPALPSPVEPLPSTSLHAPTDSSTDVPTNQEQPLNKEQTSPTSKKIKEVVKDIACCDGPVRFKRVLNVNYGFVSDSQSSSEERMTDGKQMYVCGFCKHTFKSHYCYRKHTRRHINPVPAKPMEAESRDMNVQYYPCKTCGSKFPSYYFVHKHRKMCHLNETELEDKISQNPLECSDDTHSP